MVLPASNFKHIWEMETRGEAIYKGTLLGRMSSKARGEALAKYTWQVIKERFPDAKLEKPARGVDCNGRPRCRGHEPYDLLWDGQRVEIKSSLLPWVGNPSGAFSL